MKKYLFGILAITLAVGFSAFTTKKAHKPFATKDVWLVDGSANQRMTPNNVIAGDADQLTLTLTAFNNQISNSAWTDVSQSYSAYSTGTDSYIAYFTIDNFDSDEDANDADGITISQALNALKERSNAKCDPDFFDGSGFVAYPTSTNTVVVDPNLTGDGNAKVTITFFRNDDVR